MKENILNEKRSRHQHMLIVDFWVVMLYSLAGGYQCFEGM
jgi:hypothetical protein